MNHPAIQPAQGRAPAIDALTLKRWLDQGHDDEGRPVVALDTRNAFEVDHGTFEGAIDWRLAKFSEFPRALDGAQGRTRRQDRGELLHRRHPLRKGGDLHAGVPGWITCGSSKAASSSTSRTPAAPTFAATASCSTSARRWSRPEAARAARARGHRRSGFMDRQAGCQAVPRKSARAERSGVGGSGMNSCSPGICPMRCASQSALGPQDALLVAGHEVPPHVARAIERRRRRSRRSARPGPLRSPAVTPGSSTAIDCAATASPSTDSSPCTAIHGQSRRQCRQFEPPARRQHHVEVESRRQRGHRRSGAESLARPAPAPGRRPRRSCGMRRRRRVRKRGLVFFVLARQAPSTTAGHGSREPGRASVRAAAPNGRCRGRQSSS